MPNHPHLAIVGATGAVGEEMLKCLEQRDLQISGLTLLASARSAGKTLRFRGEEQVVKELGHDSFSGIDIALFSAGGGISEEFGPSAAASGAVVIDNSSAFRMDSEVPLVVPEINPGDAAKRPKGIIANPNCTTIITLMGLYPLHRKFGLKSIIASSYQAVSGSGTQGILELEEQYEHAKTDGLDHLILPLEAGLDELPRVHCPESSITKLRNGNPALVMGDVEYGDECWAEHGGQAIAVGVFKAGEIHPTRVFVR